MTAISIARLLNGGRPDDHTIAVRRSQTLLLGQLRRRIAHNGRRLACRTPGRALLVCDDSAEFLAGLLTLATLGWHTILPPNAQAGTIKIFAESVDLVVTDERRLDCANLFMLEGAEADCGELPIGDIPIDFFTSGSTGAMKRVEKSLAALEREGEILDSVWGATVAGGAAYGTVSHQHIFGLAFKVIWPLLSGRPFAAECYLTWESLLRDLTAKATIVSSPAHLTRLGGLPPVAAALQPRLIFTAGAPMPAEAVRETEAVFGAAPVEIFGSTETSALAWRRGVSADPLWQVLPGIEASADSDGLLDVRSPFVLGDGCCRLSDRVEFETDGRFRFLGRSDGIVKIEGRRINIVELEQRIASLPWIGTAAVAALPGPRVRLGAVATLNEAGAAALAQAGQFRFIRMLRRALLETHDAAVLPRHWRFVDQIPMDRMGKRRQRDIAALFGAPP